MMNYTVFTKDFNIPDGIKIISFDIFDTLILRPFEKPTDLFTFLNPLVSNITKLKLNFRKVRKLAEKRARNKAHPREEITLSEIYDNLTEVPQKFRNAIKFLETEAEARLCFARKSGEILYEIAKKHGVKLVAVSDTPHELQFIKNLLAKNNFKFDEIFCSSFYKKTKNKGTLFTEVLKKTGVLASEVLHIGDNENSDIKKANEIGLHTFYLPLLKNEFYKNSFYKNILKHNKCLLTSASISMMCEKLDEGQSASNNNSLFEGSLYKLGFNAFGSILLAYTNWVFEMSNKHKVKKLFFVARDGFIMHKAFQILYPNKAVNTVYLECSRRSLTSLLINDMNDVVKIFTKRYRNTSIKEFILQKLECDPSKIESQIQEFGFKSMEEKVKSLFVSTLITRRLKKIVLFYADEILEKMQKEKRNTLSYLKKVGALEEGVAICDVGYGGTIQKIISKTANLKNCFGFYLITNQEAKDYENIFGFLTNKSTRFEFKIISSFVKLIESVILSAPSGTVLNYNSKGNPVYQDLKESEAKRLEVNSFVWNGMMDFIILAQKRFGNEMEFLSYNKNLISKIFTNFVFSPLEEDAKILNDVVFENKSNAGGYLTLIENNLWKMGAISVKYPQIAKTLQIFIKIWLKCNNLFNK